MRSTGWGEFMAGDTTLVMTTYDALGPAAAIHIFSADLVQCAHKLEGSSSLIAVVRPLEAVRTETVNTGSSEQPAFELLPGTCILRDWACWWRAKRVSATCSAAKSHTRRRPGRCRDSRRRRS